MDLKNIRPLTGNGQKLYIETYGCQMNVGDTEIVVSIMRDEGFEYTGDISQADIILINTCSIRDNAEQRIWGRLSEFKKYKKDRPGVLVGVIGCMASRLKEQLMERERAVDIVAGPDSYRDLPNLVKVAANSMRGINVELSKEETYAEISPVRLDKNGVSAFISIMRGCDNMCSYCVVPYTRGRERSRDPETIIDEAKQLFGNGYREITLLGQNVNSYSWQGINDNGEDKDNEFRILSATNHDGNKERQGNHKRLGFPGLMAAVASISPELRVRFATSHPKDLSDELLEVMAAYPNICRSIHLPAQSGSSRMLQLMNRKYTREWYLDRVAAIKKHIPDCSVTTDLIAGFCGETEEDHLLTLSLMSEVGYDFAYMFKYSERPDTKAARTMPDDVPDDIKTRRLNEIIALQNQLSLDSNKKDIGREFEVLVEGISKKRKDQLFGRSSQNKVVVFDRHSYSPGDYVNIYIDDCTPATLIGKVIK